MAKPVVVSIPHSLGKDEAARRLKRGMATVSDTLTMLSVDEETWTGDSMTFRVRALGQAASGKVSVADDHVQLEVMLPLMLQGFADVAIKTLSQRGRLLLEKY